ncbi:Gamma-glutamylputrescine oxidoreductase [Legionella beliardensis]|uniref:Gamma-glutamylputrescine oxidoreductase n=1 Tax=Legionella beliardensis TaxID=91822 RepID=A0A378I2N6_9GAMM|nr:FAD-dependent oxidoreductase [Legionella beliardensis]STX29000.1 Gamma-glutamylputrescine oxidoreductase [Legionella beliardensis]
MEEGKSLWVAISKREKNYPTLMADIEVDVAIVGGGITAVTAACQLIEAGKRVAIIEAGQIGGLTTSYSTGNLYVAVQPFYQTIEKKFDLDTAKVVAQSRLMAIDHIEKNVREKNINCHFNRRPWYCYTTAAKERASIEKEVELFKRLGIDIDYTTQMPLAVPYKKAAVMPNQARFNPLQYVISMADYLHEKGCMIYENTQVTHFEEKEICFAYTKNAKIKADKLFLATHTPLGINNAHFFTAPYRSYVVAVRLKNHVCPEGHFWDLSEQSHIFSAHAYQSDDPELLMLSGSHHKTGQGNNTEKHYQELETYLKTFLPIEEVIFKWSAQHYKSADNIPYIGLASRTAKHTFMATGYFADGLTYGTLAGLNIADLILKKTIPFKDVYQANRNTLGASLGFMAKENSNVAMQYSKDLPIAAADIESVKEGEGKVIEINKEKFAVCRDKNELHMVSAVCPHMKCIVNWNSAEKTWDCPCHGSRFTKQGKYIEGPAMADLTIKQE